MALGDISIIVEDSGISTAIQKKLSYLLDDWEVQEGVTEIVKDAMNKFVPMRDGTLRESAKVNGDEIVWTAPYAHYQYTGEVYGPNFPIGNGEWRSRKGKNTKRPMGWSLTYHTEGTTDNWDYAMMRNANARRIMNVRITAYLKRMARKKGL